MNLVESQFWSIQNSASSKSFDILVKSQGHSYLFFKIIWGPELFCEWLNFDESAMAGPHIKKV